MTKSPTSAAAPVPERAWHDDVMGMTASIRLRGTNLDSATVTDTVADAFAWLHHVDTLLSPYRPGSDLSRVMARTLRPRDAHPMLTEVLELCAEAVERTDGWFDPAVRTPAGPAIDPTGLVKGWAVQHAGGLLDRLGDIDHYVAVAGDLSLAVHRDDTPPWRVGVTAPGSRTELLTVAECRTGGMATSGTGERGGHVRDPFTGRPATELAAVTVLGPELLWADVHATAALARGLDALTWLPTLTDHHWYAVAADGRTWRSPAWPTQHTTPGHTPPPPTPPSTPPSQA